MDSASKKELITLCVLDGGEWKPLYHVNEAFARRHLTTVSTALDALDPNTTDRRVNLAGASAGFLREVLDLLHKYGEQTQIRVHGEPLQKAIGFYQATRTLGVWPHQSKVEGHLVAYLSHNRLVGDDIAVVQKALGHLGRANPPWRAMVDQLAWYLAKDLYDEDDVRVGVIEAIEKHPQLQAAVWEKIQDVWARREFNKLDRKERKRTGSKEQLQYTPPAPLTNNETPIGQSTEAITQSIPISTKAAGETPHEADYSATGNMIDPRFAAAKTSRDDDPRIQLFVGNNTIESRRALYGVRTQPGIQSVIVDIELDAGFSDFDELEMRMTEWAKILKDAFGK